MSEPGRLAAGKRRHKECGMRQEMNNSGFKILKVGIVGLGAIGSFLISELATEEYIKVTAGADVSPELRKGVGEKYPDTYLTDDFKTFPDDLDVIVECASASIADAVAKFGIERGKAVVIASVGGLSDIRPLRHLARETGGQIYIPSGAIAGLDALKAIPKEAIQEVRLTTTKHPSNFKGSSYIAEKGIDLDAIRVPTVIFDGYAGEAVKAFPKNINVSATLSYAGIGRNRTKVTIVANPLSQVNRHEICIKSTLGDVHVEVNNVPFEINPRTSKLAAYSILATIKHLVYTITIG